MASKEQKIQPLNKQQKPIEEYTKEELLQVVKNLNDNATFWHNKCQELLNRVQEMDRVNAFKRLDYLFEVVKADKHFDAEFVTICAEEIKDALTVVEEKPTEQEPAKEEE